MNLIISLIWIALTIFEYVLLENKFYDDTFLKVASDIVVLNIIVFFITLKISKENILSFYSAFIVFLYLFHFGQVFCTAYFSDMDMGHINYVQHYMTNTYVLKRAIIVCLTCINCLCIGGAFWQSEKALVTNRFWHDDSPFIYSFCEILFWLTLPVNVWLNMKVIGAAMIGGYRAANEMESVSGVFSAIANLWYLVLPFYYVLSSSLKKKLILFPCLFYIAFTMLTGNRGHQIVNLFSFFLLVYYAYDIKINVKKVVVFSPVLFVTLVILDMIFLNRSNGIIYILSNFFDLFLVSLKNNIIITTIYNFGVTLFTPYLTIEKMDVDLHPFFFESYVKSLSSIIPNIGGALTDLYREGKFSNQLNTNHAIGGSFIAELYYNCGSLYTLFAVIFGYYYKRISSFFIKCIKSGWWARSFVAYSFASLSMWWVRDSFFNMIRLLVWSWILYSVCYKIYSNRNKTI